MPKRRRIGFLANIKKATSQKLTPRELNLLNIFLSILADFERHQNKKVLDLFNNQLVSLSKLLEDKDAKFIHGFKILGDLIKSHKDVYQAEKKAIQNIWKTGLQKWQKNSREGKLIHYPKIRITKATNQDNAVDIPRIQPADDTNVFHEIANINGKIIHPIIYLLNVSILYKMCVKRKDKTTVIAS